MYRYIPFLCWILVLSSCVTQKRKKSDDEVSKIGKIYHNITSKYNRNFNAKIILAETQLAMNNAANENYDEILPIYPYMEAKPEQHYEELDAAIEKCGVAIILHRASDWTDDNYHLIGKAQFYKQDFESAEQTFRYIEKYYNPYDISSRVERKKLAEAESKRGGEKSRAQQKEEEKEREEKIKERQKTVKNNKKNNSSKSRKQQIKDRKKQIKDRERLAKANKRAGGSKSNNDIVASTSTDDSANKTSSNTNNKKKKEKDEELFVENPELPKIEGNSQSYFLKHKPIYQNSQLWLARTLVERDRYWEAERILNELVNDEGTFDDIRQQAYLAQAYFHLDQEETDPAINPMRQAKELARDKYEKARYAFILAQLYERTNQLGFAGEMYKEVEKLHPEYEMEINAILNMNKMNFKSGSMEADRYVKTLERLANNEKNIEYQDIIYSDIGEMHLADGNAEEAIRYFKLSAQNSTFNRLQKANSYYQIADLYFQDKQYDKAKYYFDSTLMNLPQEDERYELVQRYTENLAEIATNLEVIQLQDSLINLSKLSEKELRKLAVEMKKQEELERLNAAEESEDNNTANRPINASLGNQRAGIASTVNSNNNQVFFAYDDKLLKKGVRDFQKEWGELQLQDNWRVSDQSGTGFDVTNTDEETGITVGPITDTELDEIFADVPKNQEGIDACYAKIDEAKVNLGRLYQTILEDYETSIRMLEEVLTQNPEIENKDDIYYLLYVGHSQLGNTAKAEEYKQKIAEEYPESEYAEAIQPKEKVETTVYDLYKDIYSLYEEGRYQNAMVQIDNSYNTYGRKHDLLSKMSLLRAMCMGQLKGKDAYVNSLKDVIAKYPNTTEEEKAKDIIRLLGIQFTETSKGIQEINEDTYFEIDGDEKLNFVLISSKKPTSELNKLRVAVSDFNKKFYKLKPKQIGVIVLEDGEQKVSVVTVRRFLSRDEALEYFNNISENLKEFISLENLEFFITTMPNYRKLIQVKSVDLYREFFINEYLK